MKLTDYLIYCASFVGIPYIWGGSNPLKGLDCSGLVQILLSKLGLDPIGDQTAHGLMLHFLDKKRGDTVSKEYKCGDLIFYGKNGKATHIGMFLSPTKMIEAAGGGSACTTVQYARAIGAQVKISNPWRRSDVICIIRPKGLGLAEV